MQPKAAKHFGKVCAAHPVLAGERYASGPCVGCSRERRAKYRRENLEAVRAEYREWYAKNKERRAVYCREWQDKNKDYVAAKFKIYAAQTKERRTENIRKWRKENKQRTFEHARQGRIRRERLIGGQALAKAYSEEIRAIYRNCPKGHHVDHIVPLRGDGVNGLHVPWNLQYLPAIQNWRKGNRL